MFSQFFGRPPMLYGAPSTLPAAILSHAIKLRMKGDPQVSGPPTVRMPQVYRPRTPHQYY